MDEILNKIIDAHVKALEDLPPAERARFWIDSEGKISALPSGQIATDKNVGDTISRQQAIDIVRNRVKRFTTACVLAVTEIEKLPSAQPERLIDDDFEAIRIHLNAYKEKLCNQQRWEEAEEYQRIIDRFMAFASAQPETHDKRTETHACDLSRFDHYFQERGESDV